MGIAHRSIHQARFNALPQNRKTASCRHLGTQGRGVFVDGEMGRAREHERR